MEIARNARWAMVGAMVLGLGTACADAPERSGGEAATDTDIVYVDVRTDAEFAAGHVEGAIHIPHTEMADRYDELEQYRDDEIVVYCRSGRRSGIAKSILEDEGFDNVTNGGGLTDLHAQGVPTTPNCC